MHYQSHAPAPALDTLSSLPLRNDPRARMAAALPGWMQPFLTWVTAKPAPGEEAPERHPASFVASGLAAILGGAALTLAALMLALPWWLAALLVTAGLTTTCSGLGLYQVVIFHHCSHGTVFATRERNRQVGRIVSALLLFTRFEDYQRDHMLHHSANKLLTEEDEFTGFVFGVCGLEPGVPLRTLWRRVIVNLVSPAFHIRFLRRRLKAAMFSGDRAHDWMARAGVAVPLAAAAVTGAWVPVLVAWFLPLTVLLQVATVFRILCEHRFPDVDLIRARGKAFVCASTTGVFPGAMPPDRSPASLGGLTAWGWWWARMLVGAVFARVFVLVGDAPCHDFHHRRPATKKWTQYSHARQQDLDAGSPGFPANYSENWGLIRAVDRNLATLAATPPGVVA
ncbi:fatty acid desaturase [Roseomonas sp. OT10]|uniref:fatty acid desaturase n=1 Tax=Roseomonas cutis TaxID=2897332 RepID=UPI001E44AF7B|nr:fatty acid desaturase [Roseomonas sp. OT10]UFN50283.1 fatty acid desaturase [Roseomonas sp. OT10]